MSARSSRTHSLPRLRPRRSVVLAIGAACVGLALGLFGNDAAGDADPDFKLIVHPENPSRTATRQFLADAFLKNVVEWPDGQGIHPVDQHREAAVRHRFSKQIVRRSVAAIRHYWQQRIFSGRGVPPPELESDAAVVAYVLRNRGAVGYVSAGAEINGAHVIAVR